VGRRGHDAARQRRRQGEQLAALETEYHALVTAPKITRLLDRAQANTPSLEDWQIANLREMRRQRDFAIATPVALVSRLAKAASKAEMKWLQARESGKFEDFAPYPREVVHLVRDKAQLLGQSRNLSPYDALVDEFSPGLTAAEIEAMFKSLARRLPGLIREVLRGRKRSQCCRSRASSAPAGSGRWRWKS
jgi:carboxypeptidase Taq